MYDQIAETILHKYHEVSNDCTSASCPKGDIAGCVVRLVGHDFMDFSGGAGGGSDACLNFTDPDNAGLKGCLLEQEKEHHFSLEELWQPFCDKVSLADFLVLAAEVLLTTARHVGTPSVDLKSGFRFGRPTRVTCEPPALPNPDNSCQAVEESFVNRMGLSWRLSTALMGVHSLGRAQVSASGFDGFWTHGHKSKTFDHHYYIIMLGAGWKPGQTSKGKWQWIRADSGSTEEMMLNTDMCLAFKTKQDTAANIHGPQSICCLWTADSGMPGVKTQCPSASGSADANACCQGVSPCPGSDIHNPTGAISSQSSDAVKEFAKDEDAWLDAFQLAWKKATENGLESALCPGAPTTTAPCDR